MWFLGKEYTKLITVDLFGQKCVCILKVKVFEPNDFISQIRRAY